jgi:hypothetical protein
MGYAVVTTVVSAAASANLTDLATVKDELSIDAGETADDTWLTRAIGQVSSAIANHTKRVFPPELVRDDFDVQQDPFPYQTPGGFAQLELSRWPVLAIVSVTQTLAVGSTQTLVEGVDFRTDQATGRLSRLNPFTGVGTAWEAIPVTVLYTAGYGALVTESHAVPATPYRVTVTGAASFSCPQSVSYANGTPLTLVAANPTQGQYALTATVGQYQFAAADAGQILTFVYASVDIPDDLVDACLRLITARYMAKGRDPALVQQDTPGVGTQRFWFGGAPGQKGPFPPDIQGMLDAYRTPTLA